MRTYQAAGLLCIALLIHAQSAEKIIPHRDANSAPFPFLVRITADGSQLCCGTIVSTRYVMTAGACVWANYETKSGKVDVVIGLKSDYEKIYEVEEQIEHAKDGSDDTIGLLRTAEEISYHEGHVEPAKLSSRDYDISGYPVVVYGDIGSRWDGDNQKGKTWMQITKILDNKLCKVKLAKNVSDAWMCSWRYTNYPAEWHYLQRGCPILADGLQIGITSFVDFDYHTVKIRQSVRLYHYLDWIQTQANLSLPRLESNTLNHQRSSGVTARISYMFTCVYLCLSWITK